MDSTSHLSHSIVSDSLPTPRGSSECRQNAQRGRQQSDWFSHESSGSGLNSSRPTPGSTSSRLQPPSSNARPTSPTAAAGLSSQDSRGSTPAPRRTYHRTGPDPQTWYKYGSDFKDEIIGQACSSRQIRGTLGEGSDVKKKMTECNSNNWFRHEHAPGEKISAVQVEGKKKSKSVLASESQNSPWTARDVPDTATKLSPRPETAEYMRRHKGGKSSEWFSHDHAAVVNGVAHHKGNEECAQNAAKFKGETSKDWFSHDASDKYVEPKPVPKLTSPEAKLLMERSKGDEMKQVFRMDQNLKITWTAPSDEPLTDHKAPAAEGSQTLVEKFLKDQNSITTNGSHDT